MRDLVTDAVSLARQYIDIPGLERRWLHLQGVARRATESTGTVTGEDREVLVAAAWLHDIGYNPDLAITGLHTLDGAVRLHRMGYPDRVVALVAHHSAARFEAHERGLSDRLSIFAYEDSPVMDALVTADMTTGPAGETVTLEQRLAEIYTATRQRTRSTAQSRKRSQSSKDTSAVP